MRKRVVLVGGGHSHLHVIQAWQPLPSVELILVSDRARALYSGMLPGWLCGEYEERELSVDLASLCARSGVRFVESAASSIDVAAREIELENGTQEPYDAASFDIGSTVAGLPRERHGMRAVAARPVAGFLTRMRELRASAADVRTGAAVVGAGAAGIELALALRQILPRRVPVHLIDGSHTMLPQEPARVRNAARDACLSRGVELHLGRAVADSAEQRGSPHLVLSNGEVVGVEVCLWVTGAAAPELFRNSGVATDARGFVRVRETLQWIATPDVFAAGDCAALDHAPETPRSGVHAVRAGPVLLANLRARLSGGPLRPFVPQRHTLMMLNLGDGEALAAKWGFCVRGRFVRALKDRIDRRFMLRYQAEPGRDPLP